MRLVARFPDKSQVGFLVDSLRDVGFNRKDMIISDAGEEQKYDTFEEAADELAFIKTERDGLGEVETFAQGIKGLKGRDGIIVAVKVPKHESSKVRSLMEQSGAVEIVQD